MKDERISVSRLKEQRADETCVSMGCPFVLFCKHYSIDARHEGGICGYQDKMLLAAEKLKNMRALKAKHPEWSVPDIMFALQKKGV